MKKPWRGSSALADASARQSGHVPCLFTHGEMHLPWNRCWHSSEVTSVWRARMSRGRLALCEVGQSGRQAVEVFAQPELRWCGASAED